MYANGDNLTLRAKFAKAGSRQHDPSPSLPPPAPFSHILACVPPRATSHLPPSMLLRLVVCAPRPPVLTRSRFVRSTPNRRFPSLFSSPMSAPARLSRPCPSSSPPLPPMPPRPFPFPSLGSLPREFNTPPRILRNTCVAAPPSLTTTPALRRTVTSCSATTATLHRRLVPPFTCAVWRAVPDGWCESTSW
jgi:hypothetical protein